MKKENEKPVEEPDGAQEEETREETPEEKSRRECAELMALCLKMSERISQSFAADQEFIALTKAIEGAYEEYRALMETGKRTKRARHELEKRQNELNYYCFYKDINAYILTNPRAYACMLCQNKQLIPWENGEPICKYFLEQTEGNDDC